MAACLTCQREMLMAPSCRPRLGAVRYGSEQVVPDPWPERCRDCAVTDGGIHHDGCCLEECPACGGQRLGCPCNRALRPARRLLRILHGGQGR
jgi:hypothetical protein